MRRLSCFYSESGLVYCPLAVPRRLIPTVSNRRLSLDPDGFGKYSGAFQLGIHVHPLTRFQLPLIRCLTIAIKARAYVESQAHFLFAAKSLYSESVLDGIELCYRAPNQ